MGKKWLDFPGRVYETHVPKIKCLLVSGGHNLLLIRPGTDKWIIPQGKILGGQTVLDALFRLLVVDVGLYLEVSELRRRYRNGSLKVLGVFESPDSNDTSSRFEYVVTVVLRHDVESVVPSSSRRAVVSEPFHLWNQMAASGSASFVRAQMAIKQANRRGMIGWTCDKLPPESRIAA